MGNFTTTDGSHLVRQQGDDGDGFSRECDELDLVALAVPMLHDDRAEITGLQALIRKILARECFQAMVGLYQGTARSATNVSMFQRGRAQLACCKVGLGCPLIPTAFVADLFRSARVTRPRRSADRRSPGDAPTVGDWATRGRRGKLIRILFSVYFGGFRG
jgi:hypothetical protein